MIFCERPEPEVEAQVYTKSATISKFLLIRIGCLCVISTDAMGRETTRRFKTAEEIHHCYDPNSARGQG